MAAQTLLFSGVTIVLVVAAAVKRDPVFLGISALCGTLFGLCATHLARRVATSRDRIAVDQEGISYISANGATTSLQWREVAAVEDHGLRRRLVLRDSQGNRKIIAQYQLAGFGELLDFILAHSKWRHSLIVSPSTLRKSYGRRLFALFIFAFLLALSIPGIRDRDPSAVFPCLFMILPIYLFITEERCLVISSDSFTIEYVWRRNTIALATIGDIYVYCTQLPTRTGTPSYSTDHARYIVLIVRIQRSDGTVVELSGYREGAIALYDALLTAWSRWRAQVYPLQSPQAQ